MKNIPLEDTPTGTEIFRRSLRMLFGRSPKEILQIAAAPLLACVLFLLVAISLDVGVNPQSEAVGGALAAPVITACIFLFLLMESAIRLHRMIILNESPGWLPLSRPTLVGGYFGRSLMLVLVAVLFVVPIVLLILFLYSFVSMGSTIAIITVGIIFLLMITGYFLVVGTSMILPAASVSKPTSILQGLSLTWVHRRAIAVVTLWLFITLSLLSAAVPYLALILHFPLMADIETPLSLIQVMVIAIMITLNAVISMLQIFLAVTVSTTIWLSLHPDAKAL